MRRKNRTKPLSIILISGAVSFLFIVAGTLIYAQNPVTDTVKNKTQKTTKTIPKIGKEVYPPGTTGGPMVYVPAGEFIMGCNEDLDRKYLYTYQDDRPYHKVILDTYYIDKYEVTVGEYAKCVKSGRCNVDRLSISDGKEGSFVSDSCNWGKDDLNNNPINCIDWNQAKTFCKWAGKRLPTEAEWEKAARWVDGRIYPWGNEAPTCQHAVLDNSQCHYPDTASVGMMPKDTSPYGVMDMAGNVCEWVNDWYSEDYYSKSPVRNPRGPSSGSCHVRRGGAILIDTFCSKVYHRINCDYEMGNRTVFLGFRCARDAD